MPPTNPSPASQPTPPQPNSQPEATPAPKNDSQQTLAIVGFGLAFFMPPIGLITSIVAAVKVRKHNSTGRGWAIAGIVVGTITTALVSFGLLAIGALYQFGGGGHPNHAQQSLQPIMTQLTSLNAQQICVNGDNGYTIDNTTPWYTVYYTAPNSTELTDKIKQLASQQGYNLQTDTVYIKQLQDNGSVAQDGSEQFNAKTDYLTAEHGGNTLTIRVYRDTEVPLDCNTGTYGAKKSTGSGVIIYLDMTAPSTS